MKLEITIRYEWWGNANINNRSWSAIFPNGDMFDYGTVNQLITECETEGYEWKVLRYHRNGEISILKQSSPKNEMGE